MIGYIEGSIKKVRKDHLIVLCRSIGFQVYVAAPQSYQEGSFVELYTYQHFREDGQTLYGFEHEEDYQLFTLLIQVKGLGCKTVLNMLAASDGASIIRAIERSDAAALKKLPGIGAKTAGQILLDLKGKVVLSESSEKKTESALSASVREVTDALLSLGYRQQEVDALDLISLEKEHSKTDDLLRFSLKELARRKKGV